MLEANDIQVKNLVSNLESILVSLGISGPEKDFADNPRAEIEAKKGQLIHTLQELKRLKPDEFDAIFLESFRKMAPVMPKPVKIFVTEVLRDAYLN